MPQGAPTPVSGLITPILSVSALTPASVHPRNPAPTANAVENFLTFITLPPERLILIIDRRTGIFSSRAGKPHLINLEAFCCQWEMSYHLIIPIRRTPKVNEARASSLDGSGRMMTHSPRRVAVPSPTAGRKRIGVEYGLGS